MNNDNRLMVPERTSNDPLAGPLQPQTERGFGYGYGYAGAREESGGFKVREAWRVVKKNLWLIVTLCCVITTVVTIAAYRVESRYLATATVQIENPNQDALFKGGESVYIDFGSDKYYRTQLKLLQNPTLARKVALELDLEHNPDFISHKPPTLTAALFSLAKPPAASPPLASAGPPVETPRADQPIDEEAAKRLAPYVGIILGGLSISEVPTTQLISISFEHHDPEIAAKVANSIAENFAAANLSRRTDTSVTQAERLQKSIAELQSEIRAGEERLLNYARQHEILDVQGDENPAIARLSGLNDELLKVQTELQQIEASREAMSKVGLTDIMRSPLAQGDPGAQEVVRQLGQLQQRRSELLQTYTEEYPEVRDVSEQIRQKETELEKVRERLVKQAQVRYEELAIRERKLRADIDEQRADMMQHNEAGVSAGIIKTEIETKKSILKQLLERQNQLDLNGVPTRNNVYITDIAQVPGSPIGPDRSRWILLSVVASLVCGLGLAFGREFLDQTIKSIEDVGRVVQLPSLGVIPALGAGQKRSVRKRLAAANNGAGPASAELITSLDAKSSAAEAYRQLRTSVLLSSAGHPSRLLLVTSSQPREGKTTTAVNTAISLAQTGASVLIIDCDMRKPRVHHALNAENVVGVSLYLSGQNEDISQLTQKHQIPNLWVMPCGPIPPNPAELLGSDQMRKLLSTVVEHFDHVVIDTPPVIAFADAVILSTMVDGVILVVRGGYTNRTVIARSRQILGEVGAKIYGVVLNDADMKASESYYYYDYKSYYGDGDSSSKGASA